MSIRRSRAAGMAMSCAFAGMVVACSAGRAQTKAPATPAAATAAPKASQTSQVASHPPNGAAQQLPTSVASSDPSAAPGKPGKTAATDEDDAELVVARDVVAQCPTLRLVRHHIAEFDPDMIWLAVLESIAECMGQGGTMAGQAIGVSGDEDHRHIVREVLGARGVAPTRVVAKVPQGSAECQGGTNCNKRVEITIVSP